MSQAWHLFLLSRVTLRHFRQQKNVKEEMVGKSWSQKGWKTWIKKKRSSPPPWIKNAMQMLRWATHFLVLCCLWIDFKLFLWIQLLFKLSRKGGIYWRGKMLSCATNARGKTKEGWSGVSHARKSDSVCHAYNYGVSTYPNLISYWLDCSSILFSCDVTVTYMTCTPFVLMAWCFPWAFIFCALLNCFSLILC